MLSLKNIIKEYSAGNNTVRALDGVSIDFREHEFVSVLGPSGCGKTTLLNIIGGLDQYTSGDLQINGISTKQYKESDWDNYRNHSIGFVFQNYNLIPHQTVLANVELALTLSGVSRAERRSRALDALRQVGLEDQIHKKPNQMSGGQMQRVAIARALVNDPDILLADEPTGALDTQTSIQIMEILRSISEKKLIIMVTHNPDLAQEYSTRIIRLLDGRVVDDSAPAQISRKEDQTVQKRRKKKSMSFWTALSLSLNNLLTKKGRTFMTSFAGSIGIIGIALILSVSSGVNSYINSVQRNTLSSYPIELNAENADISALVTAIMGSGKEEETAEHDPDKVYESTVVVDLMNSINNVAVNKNDLASFKRYMETNHEKFDPYVSAVQYRYDFNWRILTPDTSGKIIKSDITELFKLIYGNGMSQMMGLGNNSAFTNSSYKVWEELLEGTDGELIHPLLKEQYDLVYGTWPTEYNEVVLVVTEKNEVSDLALYALGLRTYDEIRATLLAAAAGDQIDTSNLRSYTFEEMLGMQFKLLLASDCYQMTDGVYEDRSEDETGRKILYASDTGIPLKVVGIIRPNPDATATLLTGTVAYTAKLSRYALEQTAKSPLLTAQQADPSTDVLTGLPFVTASNTPTEAEKIADAQAYAAGLSDTERAELYRNLLSIPTEQEINATLEQLLQQLLDPEKQDQIIEQLSRYSNGQYRASDFRKLLDSVQEGGEFSETILSMLREPVMENIRQTKKGEFDRISDEQILGGTVPTDAQYLLIYEEFMPPKFSESTYAQNLSALGYVSEDSPQSIRLFAASFENKDEISKLISAYNKSVEEEKQISYTDYVALLMSSITTIVNAITYVLIAFVAISLVVSSIMIGIITYISVLERTKEIGILRSIGASRRDVGRVFNAETLIVGFIAGVIGIVVTLLLNQIINLILYHLTGIANLRAVLPPVGAIALLLISMFLTFIAGLFPSGFAARRNPVEALRTE